MYWLISDRCPAPVFFVVWFVSSLNYREYDRASFFTLLMPLEISCSLRFPGNLCKYFGLREWQRDLIFG